MQKKQWLKGNGVYLKILDLQGIFSVNNLISLLFGQGISSTSCSVRSFQKAFVVGHNQISNFSHRRCQRSYFKSNRGKVFASATRDSWDIGRFLKTLFFFNGPPNPLTVSSARHFSYYPLAS